MTQIDSEQLIRLARAVADAADEEIDCAVFLDRMAAYLELYRRGTVSLPPELAPVEQHLRVCPECYEEFQALLSL